MSDSLTIVVSEETGKVSIALDGELYRNVDAEFLKNKLAYIQKREAGHFESEIMEKEAERCYKNSERE